MSDLEMIFWYVSERGVYLLPMASVVIVLLYFLLGWLTRKFIHQLEMRVLFYIITSSLIASIATFYTGFSGNNMFIEEIPYFMCSAILVLYIVYLPIYVVKKVVRAKKGGVKTA